MREYLLTLLVAAAVTYLLTPLVERLARVIGAVPPVRSRDVHREPIPRLGGLAMYGGLLAGLLVASELPRLRVVFQDTTWLGLLAGGGLIAAIGFVDDRWGMDAFTKFAGQVAAAGVLLLNGVQVLWLPLYSGSPLVLTPQLGAVLTVAMVVITVNAVNFVDGLDGLAAGIVTIAALAFFTYSYTLSVVKGFERQTSSAMIATILAGMCLGFLPHNFHPARIFMGDTGSMLIGLLLASSSITSTGLDPAAAKALNLFPTMLLPLVLPLAVAALPLIDLAMAVVRRTRAGLSPFAPDKKHLHHRLLEIGHSHSRAVLLMYLWTGVIAFLVALLSVVPVPWSGVVLSGAIVVAGLGLLLMTMPRFRARRPS